MEQGVKLCEGNTGEEMEQDVKLCDGNIGEVVEQDVKLCEGNIGEVVEQDVKLCDKVKTVRTFTYLSDWVNIGRCGAAAAARARCGQGRFRECSELLYDSGDFP